MQWLDASQQSWTFRGAPYMDTISQDSRELVQGRFDDIRSKQEMPYKAPAVAVL